MEEIECPDCYRTFVATEDADWSFCPHCERKVFHEEDDDAPCCPDPDCGGSYRNGTCTFPGYADNH